ncbi:MAG TPA: M15 family metallopeptidase [Nocardioides sp.]|uniref:M15 family metallopeptidase n=1 Tax=Nocardioides sp. TaxID=35761 RepID=UPI002C79069B|nr:M15 family metallopeptidase [Nocardioides sp.]HQR26835.1 M15 family metallopeptidase [Nocardioides sp.]
MRLRHSLVTFTLALCGVAVAVVPVAADGVAADELTPTVVTMVGAAAYADEATTLEIDLATLLGTPVAGAPLIVQRRTDRWRRVASVETDDVGHADLEVTLSRSASENTFRARFTGDETYSSSGSGPVTVPLVRRESTLRLSGPGTVVDETSVPIQVRWLAANGAPVAGRVTLDRRIAGGEWEEVRETTTDEDGRATVTVHPRTDTRWRARGHPQDWVAGARSAVHVIDNLPPGIPVVLPARAPVSTPLPDQPHAVGEGANPVIFRIPDAVWLQMKGRSWHQGCPVPRARLRLLRINYWDFLGYRRRGELVAHRDSIQVMADALSDLYDRLLPLRATYRVDRFGWSDVLHGADNYASMSADNSSAFNCRSVVGKPGSLSPHAWGRSIDLNPWENPYQSQEGTVPNSWWLSHSHPRVAWRSTAHEVVGVMAAHGLQWTYGTKDSQHFDVVP